MKYIITTEDSKGNEKQFEVSNKVKTQEELMEQLTQYYSRKGLKITHVKPKHEHPFKK